MSEPFAEIPASGPGKPPHPTDPARWADGTLRPGNTAALVHGAHSNQVKAGTLTAQDDARQARIERERGILADLGGEDTLSTIARDQVGRYAELGIVADYLWANLATNGVLTGKGRQRAALTAYLQTIDRLVRMAQTLGLERKARRVSFTDAVSQEPAHE